MSVAASRHHNLCATDLSNLPLVRTGFWLQFLWWYCFNFRPPNRQHKLRLQQGAYSERGWVSSLLPPYLQFRKVSRQAIKWSPVCHASIQMSVQLVWRDLPIALNFFTDRSRTPLSLLRGLYQLLRQMDLIDNPAVGSDALEQLDGMPGVF